MYQHSNTYPLEPPTCDDRAIWDIWMSTCHFPALVVADEIGLFRLLEKEAATAEQVARGLELGSRGTEALLGILSGLGLLTKHHGHFHLTATSRNFLLPDSPYYYGSLLQINRDHATTAGALRDALHRDKPEAYVPHQRQAIQRSRAGRAAPRSRVRRNNSNPDLFLLLISVRPHSEQLRSDRQIARTSAYDTPENHTARTEEVRT